jgi:hypothetical protein
MGRRFGFIRNVPFVNNKKLTPMPFIKNKITDKTQEQLMTAKWEDLNLMEKVLRSELESNPDMSLEKAIELSEMSPL